MLDTHPDEKDVQRSPRTGRLGRWDEEVVDGVVLAPLHGDEDRGKGEALMFELAGT